MARRAAYRIAYALSISDLESNEDEEELEADLATALGLRDELEALRNEVLGALDDEA
jgi:tellurite resistance protein